MKNASVDKRHMTTPYPYKQNGNNLVMTTSRQCMLQLLQHSLKPLSLTIFPTNKLLPNINKPGNNNSTILSFRAHNFLKQHNINSTAYNASVDKRHITTPYPYKQNGNNAVETTSRQCMIQLLQHSFKPLWLTIFATTSSCRSFTSWETIVSPQICSFCPHMFLNTT